MTLYDEYRREFPIAAEPSEFRDIVESEVQRALAWRGALDKALLHTSVADWTEADYEVAKELMAPLFDKIAEYESMHYPIDEPSREEAEAFRREQEEGLPAEDIKPGRYRMTQTTEMMVDVVEGIHGLFVMSDYWNLPIEQFYHSGVTFQADDNAEYIRADPVLSERHQRLVEAAREFLRVICSNTIQNNESLKAINALKAALEGEG